MKKFALLLITALFLTTTVATAAENPPMVRVQVEFTHDNAEEGDAPGNVNLTIPFSMLRSMEPAIQDALRNALQHGEIPENINVLQMWDSIAAAEPGEFLNIRNGENTVVVSTTETHLNVNIAGEETINVSMPISFGDLIADHAAPVLNGEGELDMDALIEALEQFEGDDLITVDGDRINARVWLVR